MPTAELHPGADPLTLPIAERPVTVLRGVGPALAATLGRLGLQTVQDLLFHLPLRYEDRTRVTPIGALRPGERAVVEGEIQLTEVAYRGRRVLLSKIADGSGFLTIRFFHFSATQQAALARGTRLRCFGEVRTGPAGLEIVHPEYRRVGPDASPAASDGLTPIYPTTEGVQQGRLRQLTSLALAELPGGLADAVDPAARRRWSLLSLESALRTAHRPPLGTDLEALNCGRHPAQRTLAFEELLAHQLTLAIAQAHGRSRPDLAPRRRAESR